MSSDSVQWLYGLQNRGIKLGLDGTRRLLELLDHPETGLPIALIGGTNGKGSVSAMLDAVLAAHGVRAGLYTSPHLVRPHERIRIGGRDIDANAFDDLLRRLERLCDDGEARGALEHPPSFFEVLTAGALLAFREGGAEVAVLEVGLGGRLDSTNATEPLVSSIVTVDLDHQGQLGDTADSIAVEKAGIARAGRPIVIGPVPADARAAIAARCREIGASLIDATRIARIEPGAAARFSIATDRARYADLELALDGEHQRTNALVAIVVLERFADAIGLAVDPVALRRGLLATRWPGRLQWIEGDPRILLDGAHNPAGAEALGRHLDRLGGKRPVLVFAAMADKDLEGMLSRLAVRAEFVVATRPGIARAADPGALAAVAGRFASATAEPDLDAAISLARRLAGERGTFVLVAGSLYLVGSALALLQDPSAPGPVPM